VSKKINLILGAVAGFIGGIVNMFSSGGLRIGIDIYWILLPVFSPVAGVLITFLTNYLIRIIDKRNKVPDSILTIISLVLGFLAGYLPFNYWFLV
jgi:ABC-type xylose transport system permease subunit